AGTGLDYYTKLREEAVRLYEYDDLAEMEAELDGDIDGEYRGLSSSDGYAAEEAPTGSI
ncbi:MAG: hypothetical protein JWM18_1922, partial [Chloroflexi bacterium]|nr:hypothetical protein [Chloroflexota bacterium]